MPGRVTLQSIATSVTDEVAECGSLRPGFRHRVRADHLWPEQQSRELEKVVQPLDQDGPDDVEIQFLES